MKKFKYEYMLLLKFLLKHLNYLKYELYEFLSPVSILKKIIEFDYLHYSGKHRKNQILVKFPELNF